MLYIIIESEYNVINPIECDFIRRYQKSSVRYVGSELQSDTAKVLSNPPLLNGEWLVICTHKKCWKFLTKLVPEKNNVLFKVYRKHELAYVLDAIGCMEYRIIDNYRLDANVVKMWIGRELQCDSKTSAYLYNRMGGRIKDVVENVQKLTILPFVNRGVINQYTKKVSTVNLSDVVQYALGVSERQYFSDIMEWLYEFRYAGKWLRKEFLKELQLYFNLFSSMDVGDLRLTNIKQYKEENGDKNIQVCSEYQIRKIMEAHSKVSTECVYYLLLQLAKYNGTSTGLYQLINVVKLGGNNVCDM